MEKITKISKGCRAILRRLFNLKVIGGKHLPETICLRWIKNLQKRDHKNTIKDWEKCKKEGLVLIKTKPSDKHISLNPKKLKEIYKLIK